MAVHGIVILVVTITLLPVSFPSNDTVIESLLGHPVGVDDDDGHNGDCQDRGRKFVSYGPSTTTVSSASEHDRVVSVSSVSLLSSSRSGARMLLLGLVSGKINTASNEPVPV